MTEQFFVLQFIGIYIVKICEVHDSMTLKNATDYQTFNGYSIKLSLFTYQ